MKNSQTQDGKRPSATFRVGAVALVFLIIGYQAALFVYKASVSAVVAHRDRPDTVYVVDRALAEEILGGSAAPSGRSEESSPDPGRSGELRSGEGRSGVRRSDEGRADAGRGDVVILRRDATHSEAARRLGQSALSHSASPRFESARGPGRRFPTRRYENFTFDPNTATAEEFQRLGFSEKQAQALLHYREKGGRFRRKEDFARSFVVDDSVYQRLAPFIRIPRLDLNTADSAAFETLPGIGPFYAGKMVAYRRELGGYSYPEQLMDLWKFDREKYDALADLVTVSHPYRYPLWTLPEDSLKRHPYIRNYAAHGIALFRSATPPSGWTVEALVAAGILKPELGAKLSRCAAPAPDPVRTPASDPVQTPPSDSVGPLAP